MPPAPPVRPLPAGFGRMDPPQADGRLPPVMPQRTADGQASHMVSPVTPRPLEQAFHSLSGREAAQGHGDSVPEYGGRKTEPTQQTGKISPVMPPPPRQARQNISAQTSVRAAGIHVMPDTSSGHSGSMSPVGKGTVSAPAGAATGNASQERTAASTNVSPPRPATMPPRNISAGTTPAAHTVRPREHAPQAAHPTQSNAMSTVQTNVPPAAPPTAQAVSPARQQPKPAAPPQETAPLHGSAATPVRQQGVPAAQQAAAQGTTPVQDRQAMPPVSRPAKGTAGTAAPRITPADPGRRPPVYPAGQQAKARGHDTASHPDVTPGVRTPDMVAPPVQPRTLRRSAQPLKSKAAPETPKGGGNHNRKRKRKK